MSALKAKCPTCNGAGIIESEDGLFCYSCLGKGWVKRGVVEHVCYPAANRRTVFGFVMISTLLIGLLMASQAKFKCLVMVFYVYLYGTFAFAIGKLLSFGGWVKSGVSRKKPTDSS